MTHWLKNLFILCSLSACAVEKKVTVSSQSDRGEGSSDQSENSDENSNDTSQTGDGLVSFSLIREKLDPKDLKITSLVVGLGRRGEAQGLNPLAGFVSFEVDARADYIKYRACVRPSEDSNSSGSVSELDGCHSGQTRFTEFVLPVFVEGKVEVQVEACVDKARSTAQSACGPISVTNFQQPKNVDVVLQPLLEEREGYLLELEDISVQVENTLNEYQRNIKTCEANGSVNPQFKKIVSDYLQMGSSLIRMSSAYYGDPDIRPLLGDHAGVEQSTESLQLVGGSAKGVASHIRSLGLSKQAIRQDHKNFKNFFSQFGVVPSLQLVPYQHSSYVRAVDGASSIIGLVFSVEQVLIVAASVDILLIRSDEDIYGTYHSIKNPDGDPDNRPTCPVREKVVYQLGALFGEPRSGGSCYAQGVPFKVNSADTSRNSSAGRSFQSCGFVMNIRNKLSAVEKKIQRRCPTCLTPR